MGTPHNGSGLASAAASLAVVMNVVKTVNSEILTVLKRDSEVLARIKQSFNQMIKSRRKQGASPIEITCFYEELPVIGVGQVSHVMPRLVLILC